MQVIREVHCIALLSLFSAIPAAGTSFNFNVNYFGDEVAILAPGSDDPVNQYINVGTNSIDWRLTAQNGYWHVKTAGFYPYLMSFFVSPTAIRTGDLTLTLYRDGVGVLTQQILGAVNQYVHMGADLTELSAGLQFDQLHLAYTLNSAVAVDPDDPNNPTNGSDIWTEILSPLPIFGAPEFAALRSLYPWSVNYGGIVYVTSPSAPIPEPGTWALLLTGGTFLAFVSRRRR